MKLVNRQKDKNNGFKLTYEAELTDRTEQETLEEWLRRERQWQKSRKQKYEIIYDMGTELYIAKVQLAELKEQDINARIMKNEMQDQLTANIKTEGSWRVYL